MLAPRYRALPELDRSGKVALAHFVVNCGPRERRQSLNVFTLDQFELGLVSHSKAL